MLAKMQEKGGNTYLLILGVQTGTVTVETSVEVSPKLKQVYPKIQLYHSCVYTQRNLHLTLEVLIHLYSLLSS